MSAATGRREPALVLGAWVLGALLAVAAAGRAWGESEPTGLGTTEAVTGPSSVRALGLAALAGAAALLLLPAGGRRVVGLLGVVLGAALAVGSATGAPGGATAWPWVAAAGGVLVAVAGAVTALRAGAWPSSGRRYERAAPPGSAGATPRDAWDALDRGEDPTA